MTCNRGLNILHCISIRDYTFLLSKICTEQNKSNRISLLHSFMSPCDELAVLDCVRSSSMVCFFVVFVVRLIQVQRDREKNMIDMHSGSPWETVTLTSLGRDKSIFESILKDARALS